jgi:hypothetical protein
MPLAHQQELGHQRRKTHQEQDFGAQDDLKMESSKPIILTSPSFCLLT